MKQQKKNKPVVEQPKPPASTVPTSNGQAESEKKTTKKKRKKKQKKQKKRKKKKKSHTTEEQEDQVNPGRRRIRASTATQEQVEIITQSAEESNSRLAAFQRGAGKKLVRSVAPSSFLGVSKSMASIGQWDEVDDTAQKKAALKALAKYQQQSRRVRGDHGEVGSFALHPSVFHKTRQMMKMMMMMMTPLF